LTEILSTALLRRETDFVRVLPPILILALAMASGFTMMGSFSTVQEAAKAEMGLSDYALSLVQGLSAAIPMVLLSIPIGIAVDRWNRVRMLVALAGIWTLGTLLTAWASGVAMLFVARMLAAIGTTGALTAALSLSADYCVPALRGRATLTVTLGKMLGTAAGFALVGWLLGQILGGVAPAWMGSGAPWRGTHLALAVVSFAAILPMLLLREPERHESTAGPDAPLRELALELWARRQFLMPLFAGQVAVVMADAAAGIWAAPVLSRRFGLEPQDFAGWMGLLLLGSGLCGALLGGFAADWGYRSERRGGLLVGAIMAAAISIPAALFPVAETVPLFAFALGVLIFAGTITGLIVSVALTVLVPNELRGLCIGAFIAVAGLIGFGAAPTLVAAVSSLLGGEGHLADALAIVGVSVSLVAFFAFRMAMRHAPADATGKPI